LLPTKSEFLSIISDLYDLGSCGRKAQKVYRVGILSSFAPFGDVAVGFRYGMTELGYIEGENIVYELQVADNPAGQQRIARKFVEDKVDSVFTFPTEASVAAKKTNQETDIPVVFAIAGIEGSSLVECVREPGGNITGVRYPGPDLVVKRFEFLLELAPQIKRLYIPYDPNHPIGYPALSALRPVASSSGVKLVENPVCNVEEIQANLQARAESSVIGMDAIQILPEALTQSPAAW
jgi:putative ABC transport system substrate-binding protein